MCFGGQGIEHFEGDVEEVMTRKTVYNVLCSTLHLESVRLIHVREHLCPSLEVQSLGAKDSCVCNNAV